MKKENVIAAIKSIPMQFPEEDCTYFAALQIECWGYGETYKVRFTLKSLQAKIQAILDGQLRLAQWAAKSGDMELTKRSVESAIDYTTIVNAIREWRGCADRQLQQPQHPMMQ